MELRVYKGKTLDDSIRLMRRAVALSMADPKTVELVHCVTRHCEARNDLCEVTAWFEFLKAHVKYMADPRTIDQFRTLERTLQFGAGDCDDMALAMNAGLETIGFETAFRVIQTVGSDTWTHVYSIVRLPKRRGTGIVPLDLTLANPRVGLQPPVQVIVKYKDYPTIVE